MTQTMHSTTILGVTRNNQTILIGDGQVSFSNTIFKGNAKKVRTLYKGKILAGFAGSTADAFTLFEKFEQKLEKHAGDIMRSSVELAKDWRQEKFLRRLEAMLIVADKQRLFILSGSGDVIEPEEGCAAIGSGGPYARAAAIALLRNTQLDIETIAKEAMRVAAETCIYTNQNVSIEKLSE